MTRLMTCQFGFKSGLSTSTSTNALRQTVNYFTDRGSRVFACFVDFTKAFDRVNYWTLFHRLLDDNSNCKIVRILAAWYSTQTCSVKWGGVTIEFSYWQWDSARGCFITSCVDVHVALACFCPDCFYSVFCVYCGLIVFFLY